VRKLPFLTCPITFLCAFNLYRWYRVNGKLDLGFSRSEVLAFNDETVLSPDAFPCLTKGCEKPETSVLPKYRNKKTFVIKAATNFLHQALSEHSNSL